MAPRKQVEIITDLEDQADFEKRVLFGDQLAIVDAYPKWTGPVKAVKNLFKQIKIDLGNDKLLGFFTACIDSTSQLEPYANTIPEPLFLIYSGGELVYRQRGCNAPLLEKKITEFLKLEHKIAESEENEAEETIIRKAIPNMEGEEYSRLSAIPDTAKLPISQLPSRSHTPAVAKTEKTFAILKPGCLELKNEILEKLEEFDINLFTYREETLTEEQVKELFFDAEGEDYFNELTEYMTSDVSCLMVLETEEGSDLAAKFCEIVGSDDIELAKENNPDSLRAIYAENSIKSTIHASKSKEAASRELALFFPNETESENTIGLVRPGILSQFGDEIEKAIKSAGFVIADKTEILLSKEQTEEYYKSHEGKDYFEPLVSIMSGGPCHAFLLSSANAIKKWRGQLGPVIVNDETRDEHPNSLRVKFQTSSSVNSLHGSSTVEEFHADLAMFFPELEKQMEEIKEEEEKEEQNDQENLDG